MEFRTSLDALKTTFSRGSCLPFFLHSRSLVKTFSTSTIASSTSSPIATAIPPRVITLTEKPKSLNTIAVTRILMGIAVSVIRVVLVFAKKRIKIIITRIIPSRSASITFSRLAVINHSCLKRSL